jgi:hypothetical protein
VAPAWLDIALVSNRHTATSRRVILFMSHPHGVWMNI